MKVCEMIQVNVMPATHHKTRLITITDSDSNCFFFKLNLNYFFYSYKNDAFLNFFFHYLFYLFIKL